MDVHVYSYFRVYPFFWVVRWRREFFMLFTEVVHRAAHIMAGGHPRLHPTTSSNTQKNFQTTLKHPTTTSSINPINPGGRVSVEGLIITLNSLLQMYTPILLTML